MDEITELPPTPQRLPEWNVDRGVPRPEVIGQKAAQHVTRAASSIVVYYRDRKNY